MIDPRKIQRAIRFVVFAAVAVMVGLFMRGNENYAIPENDPSLEPVFPGGTHVLVNEIDTDDPLERGWDVVYAMEREGQQFARFGRVRALPGDRVGEREGRLTVNDEPVGPFPIAGAAMGVVPADHVLILAVTDRVSNYPDSRELGFIRREDVKARVLAKVP